MQGSNSNEVKLSLNYEMSKPVTFKKTNFKKHVITPMIKKKKSVT